MQDLKSVWPITIKNGVRVCVTPTIQLMTGYILLEQEDWFEDEMDFIRSLVTPDMNAFDIGANHGVYGLTIASALTSGHVWAFEPTVAPGRMMERSIALNGLADRMRWVHGGLSDHDGSAEISVSGNSETNSLYGTGSERERIELYALDAFLKREGINAGIDVVKLDAEGEEVKILSGGANFFSQQSPLVMFELKHGAEVNHGLIEAFQALGYGIYRLAPGLGALVPSDPASPDSFLLNLFACKPDRAEALAARNLLVTPQSTMAPLPAAAWQELLFALPFAEKYESTWRDAASPSPEHELALSACLIARDPSRPAAQRFAMAREALTRATAMANAGKGDVALWLLRLNLCHLLGERGISIGIARKLAGLPPVTLATLKSPFLPPSPDFYHRDLGQAFEHLPDILREFIEIRQSYSGYFANDPIEPLAVLASRPGHGPGIDRRLVLTARRRGLPLNIGPDHPMLQPSTSPNWQIWREIVGS